METLLQSYEEFAMYVKLYLKSNYIKPNSYVKT